MCCWQRVFKLGALCRLEMAVERDSIRKRQEQEEREVRLGIAR
jgi:hypothetical protein